MGIAYRCDEALGCTFAVWDGDVTPEQWRDHTRDLYSDPSFPPGPLMLADLDTIHATDSITLDVIDAMAAAWRDCTSERITELHMAVLPDGAWDRARHFEQKLDSSRIHVVVFNLASSACEWLGVDPEVAKSTARDLRRQLRDQPTSA